MFSFRRMLVTVLTAVVAMASPMAAFGSARNAHADLQQWRFTDQGAPVSGISWTVDSATWVFETGTIHWMRPTPDGDRTGFVFEGRGRFRLEIPHRFEVDQLRRFTDDQSLTAIDTGFSRMIVRSPRRFPEGLPGAPDDATYSTNGLAKARHEKWLLDARLDVDARVLAGLRIEADSYVIADMETDDFGWLMLEFEPWRDEEVNLLKFRNINDFVEVWVSLDRAGHRLDDGSPSWLRSNLLDLVHVAAEIDLTDHKGSRVNRNRPVDEDWAHFTTTVTLQATRSGVGAAQLGLHSRAEITAVSTDDTRSVEVVRDHIGKRFLSINNDVRDPTATVTIEPPLSEGEALTLTFDYDMEILNFVSGDSWYPTVAYAVNDLHTARIEILAPTGLEAWAVGEPVEADTASWRAWEVSEPTKMVAFTFGKGFKEESLKVDGLPDVIVLGDPSGFGGQKKLRNVGADVINSLNFYKQYFGFELPVERIYATAVTASHGQAFVGFLHLAGYTFDAEHPGASELFRAHEVAHQMWGHTVQWRSYRDQWLSEAFAEYSAMLYVQASMPKSKHFHDILKVYTAEQLGSFKASMSKFARPWDVDRVRVEGDKLGPVAAGFRASTAEIPSGAIIQLYRKGPLVLHMFHEILAISERGERDLFREVMQEFLTSYSGDEASTEDFKLVLEQVTGKDWDPLFSSWVYGTGIPTYEWSYDVERGPDGHVLAIHVAQLDVPDDFYAVVPVSITLAGNRTGTNLLGVDRPEKTFRITLPSKPTKVELNPDYAVPARMRQVK